MRRLFLAIALISLVCTSATLAKPKQTVQRGAVLSIRTQFVPDLKIQSASMTWQAYDHVDPVTGRLDEGDPTQRLMATSFRCDAEAVVSAPVATISCKVPLDVADATYYLTSISIRTNDAERTYHWQEEPFYIEVRVKGGERVTPPYILSIQLQPNER